MAFAVVTAATGHVHCDKPGFPSRYSIGYKDGHNAPRAPCPNGHSSNYCAGWTACSGDTIHCDKPGWPNCCQTGKKSYGSACPIGHK